MNKKEGKVFLSVVIPCYNEEINLRRGVLKEVAEYLSKQSYSWEVIISDDGSSDSSKNFIKKFIKKQPGFKLIENQHQGKPFALKSGIKKARGRYTLITDMDQAAPLEEVEKLLPLFKKEYQIVIGSRGIKRKNFPFYRKVASSVFRSIRRLLILKEIVDTQCGFKVFETKIGQEIFSKMNIFQQEDQARGWRVTAFDVEFLFLAKKMDYKIAEIPVVWEEKNIAKKNLFSFIQESKEMFKEIINVRLNNLKGLYD